MLELVVVEVWSSERHDEVPESYQRTVRVCKQANYYVPVQNSHRRLVAVLMRRTFTRVQLYQNKHTKMQSSMLLAGVQWNIPVLSYFISVFSKSKSLAWSSAIPTSIFPFFCWSAGLLVGLEHTMLMVLEEKTKLANFVRLHAGLLGGLEHTMLMLLDEKNC